MTLESILVGESRARALEALERASSWLLTIEPASIQEASLLTGAAGLAIVHAHLDRVFSGRGHDQFASELLDRAVDLTEREPMPPWLGQGVSGIAWALAFLGNEEPDESDIDRGLEVELATTHVSTEWMHGVAGLVEYAAIRPSPIAERLGAAIAATLAREALRLGPEDEAAWELRLRPPNREEAKQGEPFIDLGLAHGVPGTLLALARIVELGWGDGTASALLASGTRWLLRQRLDGDGATCAFPSRAGSDRPARLAYCYGDAGVSWALYQAATARRDDTLRSTALSLARRAAGLRGQALGVHDAGLCHGASGLGHVFHRLFRASGDEALRDAARHWFDVACTMQQSSGACPFILDGSLAGSPSPGALLSGIGGIALTLATALGAVDALWDGPLLGG